jgi:ABC-type branched-subunit amino acid transport system substrate-binding protein
VKTGKTALSKAALVAVIAVVLVVGAVAAVLVLSQPSQPTVAERPLTIGFSISISGDFAVPGKKQLEGIELWKDYINGRGGIFVKDENKYYKVELKYYDDKSSKDEVIRLYEKLINEDKVDILFLAVLKHASTNSCRHIREIRQANDCSRSQLRHNL